MSDKTPVVRVVVPRVDTPPEHTCGTLFRAAVITSGCPGCTARAAAAVTR